MSVSLYQAHVTPTTGAHVVAAASRPGSYTVHVADDGAVSCTCPDFLYRKAALFPTVNSPAGHYCKHIAAVVASAAPRPCRSCYGTGILHDDLDFQVPRRCWSCRGTGVDR
jgi:hypothetical protein